MFLKVQYQPQVRVHPLANETGTRFDSLLAIEYSLLVITRCSHANCESCESNVIRDDSQVSSCYSYHDISKRNVKP